MSSSIDIRLNRQNKTYEETVRFRHFQFYFDHFRFISKDIIQGTVIISTSSSFKHNGISLTIDGSVQLHLSGKSVGVFEAFYNSTKVCDDVHRKTFFTFDLDLFLFLVF